MDFSDLHVIETRNGAVETADKISLYSSEAGWLTKDGWAAPLPVRSLGKPLLLSASFNFAALDVSDFSSDELSIMCSSHNGEQRHRQLLQRLLDRVGVERSSLHLGSHAELIPGVTENGVTVDALGHNCAGKHIASLIVGTHDGFDGHYLDPNRPLFAHLASHFNGVFGRKVGFVVDGCGYPTPCLTLPEIAMVYRNPSEFGTPLERVLTAMLESPWAAGGIRRLPTELMLRGIWAKDGFKGLFVVKLEDGEVLTLKSHAGLDESVETAVYRILSERSIDLPARSTAMVYPDELLRNDFGQVVGEMKACLDFVPNSAGSL